MMPLQAISSTPTDSTASGTAASAYRAPKISGMRSGPLSEASRQTGAVNAAVQASARRVMRICSTALPSLESLGSSPLVIAFGSTRSPKPMFAATANAAVSCGVEKRESAIVPER